MGTLKYINAGDLCIAYEESGNVEGTPIILLHGIPYDIRAYEVVTKLMLTENCRIIVPYIRGSDRLNCYLMTPSVLVSKLHWQTT